MMRSVMSVAVAALLFATGSASFAQEVFRVGIVDMRMVLVESQSGKRAKDEIEKFVKQKQDQIAKEEQQLKSLNEAYEKEQLLLTEEQRKKKQDELQQKFGALQKMSQDAQRELQQKDNEAKRKMIVEIRPIVEEIAKAEKVKIVYERSEQSVLYVEEAVDLTAKVLQAYDAKAGKK
ncbi:MAG: OmpH family outer membrane protein [Pseudomonadota bacterium]|nr:MAG: OmpH family outer membrane protein [Pseudomonadota bacterium]